MLSNVTWGEYLITLVVLIVLYYLFVGYRYYREDIKWMLTGKLQKRNQPGPPEARNNSEEFEELQAVVNDLRYAVLDKTGTNATKEELLSRLTLRLLNYSGLQKPAFRVAINNYIILHSKEICNITFSEDELNEAWNNISQ